MTHATVPRRFHSHVVVPAVFATALLLFGLAAVASAQSCGDPDGSGAITVTDGVNLLRRAAGLSALLSCSEIGRTAAPVVRDLKPRLEVGIGAIPGLGAGSALTVGCENRGTRTELGPLTSFENCRLGTIVYDGSITNGDTGIAYSLRSTDTTTGRSLDLFGVLRLDGLVLDGFVSVESSVFGSLDLFFRAVRTDLSSRGTPVGGTLTVSGDLSGILDIEQVYDGEQPVRVRVTAADGSIDEFLFDPSTGTFTAR